MAISIHPPRDPNTLSNYNNWICTHITANFDILFDQKKLVGNVIHKLKSTTNGESQEIILDSNHVAIGDVKIDGKPSEWELLPPLEPYGSALKIKLDQGVNLNETIDVEVHIKSEYQTLSSFCGLTPQTFRSPFRPLKSVPHSNG